MNAGPDQVVKSGQTVRLNGREKFDMDRQRDDYSFTWVQLFPRRPVIELSDKDILSPTFMAPKVSHNTAFVFGLSVKKDGSEHKDQVKILIIKSDDSGTLTGHNVPKKITSSQDKKHDQLDRELNQKTSSSEEKIGEEKIVRNQESTSGPLQKYNDTFTDSGDLAEVQKELYTSKTKNSFSLLCTPDRIIILENTQGSIVCTIHNESPLPIKLQLKCLGLEGTGIRCFINDYFKSGTIVVKEKSTKTFPVVAVTSFTPEGEEMKSYPITISAN